MTIKNAFKYRIWTIDYSFYISKKNKSPTFKHLIYFFLIHKIVLFKNNIKMRLGGNLTKHCRVGFNRGLSLFDRVCSV